MKTFAVSAACYPPGLADELTASLPGLENNVRGSGVDPATLLAASAVVIIDDSAPDATVEAIIAAHVAATSRTVALRAQAKALFDDIAADGKRDRAIASVLVDEINALRDWITSFKAAVAAATSLANLQSRVAALANLPDRTLAQARMAIRNRLDDGTVDAPAT